MSLTAVVTWYIFPQLLMDFDVIVHQPNWPRVVRYDPRSWSISQFEAANLRITAEGRTDYQGINDSRTRLMDYALDRSTRPISPPSLYVVLSDLVGSLGSGSSRKALWRRFPDCWYIPEGRSPRRRGMDAALGGWLFFGSTNSLCISRGRIRRCSIASLQLLSHSCVRVS